MATAPTSTDRLQLERPDVASSVDDEPGFRLDLLRWMACVASADGAINVAEYQLLCEFAQEGGSAHEMLTVLRAVERPRSGEAALAALSAAATTLPEEVRRTVMERAMPLLRLQGEAMSGFASALAGALDVPLTPSQRADCEAVQARSPSTLQTALLHPIRVLKGRPLRSATAEAFRLTGDGDVAALYRAYLDGAVSVDDLQARLQPVLHRLASQYTEFEGRLSGITFDQEAATREVEAAEQLFDQVGQRLAIVEARIRADKEQFEEEFDEIVHDAGNAVELEMLDRLKTDDWTLQRVWESMGRSTFAKELERRVDRIARRHERQLGLLKEDLRLFQQEYELVHSRIAQRTHHSRLSALMPRLRAGTRVLNAVETAADVTLGGGVVAGIGAGAAIYALGAAAVLPVIAPVAPFAGAAIAVAGALKWMMDSPGRKGEEVRDKRRAFENALRERLTEMRASYFSQLDQTGQEFLASARVLVRPLLLEAQAARDLAAIEARVARQVLLNSRRELLELQRRLQN